MLVGFQIFTDCRRITKLGLHTQPGNTDGHNCFTLLSLFPITNLIPVSSQPPSPSFQFCNAPLPPSFKSVPEPACCSFLLVPASLSFWSACSFQLDPLLEAQFLLFSFLYQHFSLLYKSDSSIMVSMRGRQAREFGRERKNQGSLLSILILVEGSWSQSCIGQVL